MPGFILGANAKLYRSPPGSNDQTPIRTPHGVGSEPAPLPLHPAPRPVVIDKPPVYTHPAQLLNLFEKYTGKPTFEKLPSPLGPIEEAPRGPLITIGLPQGQPPYANKPNPIESKGPKIIVRGPKGKFQQYQPGQPGQTLTPGRSTGRNALGQVEERNLYSKRGPGGSISTLKPVELPPTGLFAALKYFVKGIISGNPARILAGGALSFGLDSIEEEKRSLEPRPADPAILEYIQKQLMLEQKYQQAQTAAARVVQALEILRGRPLPAAGRPTDC